MRCFVLPRGCKGRSSIRYVRPDDAAKPKLQRYKVLGERYIELAAKGRAMTIPNVPPRIERPVPARDRGVWGSDALAEMLRRLGIRYAALSPGASFRGLHDSIVNHLGNDAPQLLLCLHEEHAVALAHGYAKVAGEPLAAILHSNVGLMHGTMAIFNAWCDRFRCWCWAPPVRSTPRDGALDRLAAHLVRPGGARPPLCEMGQPAGFRRGGGGGAGAGRSLTRTPPRAPVYLCFDAALQEQKLEAMPALPDLAAFQPPAPSAPDPASDRTRRELLQGREVAAHPGRARVSRQPGTGRDGWRSPNGSARA